MDGCFWHGCPEHHVRPRANAEWWDWKIGRNQERDRDTDRELSAAGWEVERVWEHEVVEIAADKVQAAYRRAEANLVHRRTGPPTT